MATLTSFRQSLAAVAAGAAMLAGCASVPAPREQMAVSRQAVANAVSAGGTEFAPLEMRSAQEKLDRANRAMDKEDYEEARRLAEQAQADARLAEKKAQAVKAERAANVTQEDIRALREEMNRKGK